MNVTKADYIRVIEILKKILKFPLDMSKSRDTLFFAFLAGAGNLYCCLYEF